MLGDFLEIARRLIAQLCSDTYLLPTLLFGITIVVYLGRRPTVQPQASGLSRWPSFGARQEGVKQAAGRKRSVSQDAFLESLPRGRNDRGETWSHEPPDYASVNFVLHSGQNRDFCVADPPEAFTWENESCSGKVLPMVRPTADPSKDKPGIYPYHDHFKGRKRLWEVRFEFKFKKVPEGDGGIRFGLQVPKYFALGRWATGAFELVIAAMRRVVGQDLYWSPGDPPKSAGEECELPVVVMPLWGFDQLIVTPEGEDPPDLHDPHFGSFGIHRADDRSKFVTEISQLDFKPGPTYTLAFWGISQFVDVVRWSVVKVLPVHVDCSTFCGPPPISVCLYSLKKGSLTKKDQRHLESRRQYYFKCELWATKKPPTRPQIESLFPRLRQEENRPGSPQKKLSLKNYFECCSARR